MKQAKRILSCGCAVAVLVAASMPAFAGGKAYTASPGDILQITVYGDGNLSGRFPVDADGAISYPLLGSVQVAGRTMNEVAALLGRPLAERIPGATVSASVSQYAPVFILGDVQTPGKYEYRPGMIALELVAMAGGLGRLDKNMEGAALRLIEARQEYADLDLQIFAQRIRRLRMQAELNDIDFVVDAPHASDPEVQALQERVVTGERRLFDIRLSTLQTNEQAFKAQEANYTQEIESLKQSIALHDQEIGLIEQDVEAARKLADKALTSQSNFRQAERELSETRRDALEMQTFLARAVQNRLVLQQQRAALRQARKDEAATALQTIDLDLARMVKRQESLMAAMAQIAAGSQAGPGSENADAVLSIVRPSDGSYRELPAGETIALRPGDILRVRFELEKPGRQASAG